MDILELRTTDDSFVQWKNSKSLNCFRQVNAFVKDKWEARLYGPAINLATFKLHSAIDFWSNLPNHFKSQSFKVLGTFDIYFAKKRISTNNLPRRQCICQRQMGSQAVLPRANFNRATLKLHIAQIRSNLPNGLKKSKFLGFDDNQVSFVNRSTWPTNPEKNLSFRSVT